MARVNGMPQKSRTKEEKREEWNSKLLTAERKATILVGSSESKA